MRTHLLLALFIATCAPLGCSGNVCQDACEKQKRCAQNLDCAKVPEAERAGCQTAKNMLSTEICAEKTTCADVNRERAKELESCELNNFCECKASPGGGDAAPRTDIFCRQPESLEQCFAPPNKGSMDKWWCSGCGDCEGVTPVAACSLQNNDCRFFATSCIPRTYGLCDGRGSDQLQFLCGYCFFREAGVAGLKECDKLFDLGAPRKEAGQ